ncbi:hypothetical protein A2115_03135 [Candidatus Woesebacteria bacterium GWA1_41_8]|uniref:UDP-N-acetylglucosamine 2-epimerase domain-containing protein n=1 Tax=Candidatus Woesebacteria bacterium GWA1_41_8 TaxID=1802471 RepID=A0A1F7WI15_9BACT|nr:MAG: hypothetical protein A2115_03135 [Candidatus Woesebacteria bacterium GWA1_41_8]
MKDRQFYFLVGTLVELIKLSPVIKEFKRRKIPFKLITSGQNEIPFEVIDKYTGDLNVNYSFREKDKKSSIPLFLIWALRSFVSGIFFFNSELRRLNKKEVYLVLHGDTVTSMIGAFLGFAFGLRIVHVESGLRSFNFFEPFPEEFCRFVVSNLAYIHFCPNRWAMNNLKGIKGRKVNTRQNTFIESLQWAAESKGKMPVKVKGKYFVLVVHRQEHVIFGKQKTKEILNCIFNNIPENLTCVFLVHELTKNILAKGDINSKKNIKKGIIYMARTSFVNFVRLLKGSEFIITDGGTNQEEAYYLGKPCLILRNVTERIEGLGRNAVLMGNDYNRIPEFIMNYKQFRKREILHIMEPSKLIVDYLIER